MQTPEIPILFENKDCVVINKPAGILVHDTAHSTRSSQNEPTVAQWALSRYPAIRTVGDDPVHRPGIVHRLDRDTSGVLLIAKTQKAFEYFKREFQAHRVRKIYAALVTGRVEPRSGKIEKPIGLKSGSVARTTRLGGAKMIKEAATLYRVKEFLPHHTLLEVEPLTGRTHQIRIHLASIGHPVAGDTLYGGGKKTAAPIPRQFLHASALTLVLLGGETGTFQAPLPEDLERCLKKLRAKSAIE